MRWVFCGLFALTLASPAAAADFDIPPPGPAANYDILRGSETVGPATFTRWSGFYAGGQIGLSNANADFSDTTQSLVAYALRATTLENQQAPSQWPVLGNANQSAIGYGAFVGYNTQWQDLILGMEANFNRASFSLHATVFADRTSHERQHGQRLQRQFHWQRLDYRPGLRDAAAAGRLGRRQFSALRLYRIRDGRGEYERFSNRRGSAVHLRYGRGVHCQ